MNYLPFIRSNGFWGGMAIGAVAAYVLTNKDVQDAIFKTAAGAVNTVRSGIEEAKERFYDAEAEVASETEAAGEEEAGETTS